jgi:hypothetical protein
MDGQEKAARDVFRDLNRKERKRRLGRTK